MTVQEKCDRVIQGLKVCSFAGCGRAECPYYEGQESEFWSNPAGYMCMYELRQDAIKLLEAHKEVATKLAGLLQSSIEIGQALAGMSDRMDSIAAAQKKMGDWRNDPATEKQMAYIREMQEFSNLPVPSFTGTTKGEASDYIDRWSRQAHEVFDFDSHGDNYGDRI